MFPIQNIIELIFGNIKSNFNMKHDEKRQFSGAKRYKVKIYVVAF